MIQVRVFGEDSGDSLDELTALLNAAYRKLADLGLRYVATWQDREITARRIRGRECWVAVDESEGDRLVGTITLHPPGDGSGHPFYERPDVAKIQQLGVLPDHQGRGIATMLMDHAEARARELGATELAGDTAESAAHLIRFYEARGYRTVGRANWDVTNYESLILSKRLCRSPGGASERDSHEPRAADGRA